MNGHNAGVTENGAPLTPHQVGAVKLRDRRSIGYAIYGDPNGDTVFWFHGTPGARTQLPHDVERLATERGLRVIGIERPGTGDSTDTRYEQIVDFVPDLVAVADKLKAHKFACVGLSGGGPFVLAAAHQLPDRVTTGVVLGGIGPTRGADAVLSHTLLLVPAGPLLDKIREPLGNFLGKAIRVLAPVGPPLVNVFFSIQPGDRHAFATRPQDKTQFVNDLIDAARRSGIKAPVSDLILFGRYWGFELTEITVPITFWGGNSDVIVPYVHAERQSKRVQNARLRTLDGRGHFAGYTSTAEVLDDVRAHWPLPPPPGTFPVPV
jgi:pimeloyl-ACP methyl ester carboxylesterase